MTKNPSFGLWSKDDEDLSDVQPEEFQDERAKKALELVENLKTEVAMNLYKDEIPRQHVNIHSHRAPFPLPPEEGAYSRPLKALEARMLLKSAGIDFKEVKGIYVADWKCLVDRDTAKPIRYRAQCVVADLPADVVHVLKNGETIVEESAGIATVHLFFAWEPRRGGWELVKAAVEKVN